MTTTPPSPSRFADMLRAEGATVIEVGDWETHNRNSKGPWGPVHGVVIHHTVTKGSASTVRICRDGYSGLPGPLCHGVITKDGKVHLVGYGRANHAGLGDPDVLAAVIAERSTLPVDNQATVDGNRAFYGFECENMGDGKDPWPAAQLEAIERVSAAICRHHGWSERSVIGHLEWQPGKSDPRGFTMDSMRTRIRARLTGTPNKPTPPPSTGGGTYTVKPGDTLSGIATAHGVTPDALFTANKDRLKDPDEIYPGQELVVPKAAPLPAPKKPKVDLSRLQEAARTNPGMKGTPCTYTGVRVVEAALVDAGLLAKPLLDGHFGSATVKAYAAWQRSKAGGGYRGTAADGIPGRDSLKRLGDKYGFTVVA
ncbi:N-acetylmuramoyl-L-alanine amidase (plasmid) [Streptomyces chartreusis]|uniref:N-acetylmuramoyl-L-alanine amidase n=1 Tax=Streptomyces chartreusis TaxID=1969 RepID=UPI0037DD98C8|nr:N-acetylmuramoyl-L-alanine amidase [Streptomyces chartreusis]